MTAIAVCVMIILGFLTVECTARNLIGALQTKIDGLAEKAMREKYGQFTLCDKIFLWAGFRVLVVGGYLMGYNGASIVLNHYLAGAGRELYVDPVYFQTSPVIDEILKEHYRYFKIDSVMVKNRIVRINPSDHGWQDINLRYMMNPFTLSIKDSLSDKRLHSTYSIDCEIYFHAPSKTYFSVLGKRLVFPDVLGVVLVKLGMAKPFTLKSHWQRIHDLP